MLRGNAIPAVLFSVTLFLSAFLLFAVQPMFTKMVLPLLGGTPAVWNTCVVFFQAMLLAGYSAAHLMAQRLRPQRQVMVYLGVLTAGLLFLPARIPPRWLPPADGSPILWLFALLSVAIRLPFFVVSATSPLLQRWFAKTVHPSSADPYFLYAASNLGSLLALLRSEEHTSELQ